jgi:hypothetical protein
MSAPTLIPGDVAAVGALATRLGNVAFETRYAATQLERLHTDTWVGKAADAFGRQAGELPPKLHRAADAFDAAQSAYRTFTVDLAAAQEQARRAIGIWAIADGDTATWRARMETLTTDDPARSLPDPGAALRSEAAAVFEDALAMVDASARRAAQALHEAAAAAPHGPGFWSKVWHETCEFADGVWDGSVGLVKFAWEFSPIRAVLDPDGFTRDAEQMGEALWWGAQHPVDFAEAVANEWMEHPAHAVGELVPGLLLAAATGGTGLAPTALREGAQATADVAASIATKLAVRTRKLSTPNVVEHAASVVDATLDLGRLGELTLDELAAIDVESVVRHVEIHGGITFTRHADGSYESPAGLIYARDVNTGEHRIVHVLRHGAPDTTKPKHTVFADQLGMFSMLDKAWAGRSLHAIGNPKKFVVDMCPPVGINGETRIVILVMRQGSSAIRTTFLEP